MSTGPGPRTRLVRPEDAPALAALLRRNRDFLAPWTPAWPDEYFTDAGQRAVVDGDLESHALGQAVPHVVLDDDGDVVGRISLNGVVRRAFQSCSIAYWVAAEANGRGLATAAVAHLLDHAFGTLGLHRVQGETLRHNAASQRVLERNGFERIGLAPRYLRIAGRWQDHVLYQRLSPVEDPDKHTTAQPGRPQDPTVRTSSGPSRR